MQLRRTTLVATAWEDNKTVRVLSTNCEPQNVQVADHRIGHQIVQINQPQNIYSYNKYMSGVDQHHQMQLQYGLGHFSKKAWKYLMWFLSQCIHCKCIHIVHNKISKGDKQEVFTH